MTPTEYQTRLLEDLSRFRGLAMDPKLARYVLLASVLWPPVKMDTVDGLIESGHLEPREIFVLSEKGKGYLEQQSAHEGEEEEKGNG